MSPETEGSRRAMSPPGIRPKNAIGGDAAPVNGKVKPPVRPRREDEDSDEILEPSTLESHSRERGMSPDQVQARAKSPSQNGLTSRAVSPTDGADQAQPNIMSVSMSNVNITGRTSPAVDRAKYTPDSIYNSHSRSPSMNGYAQPPSRAGSGSVTNVAADLLKEIKSKDAELESAKKQMAWMKEALGKAAKMGYVYAEKEGSDVADTEDLSSNSDVDIILKFKSFKAQIQARQFQILCPHLSNYNP